MAPNPLPFETSSAPLADYFFIAGVDVSQIVDAKVNGAVPSSPIRDETIQEDKEDIDHTTTRVNGRPFSAEAVPDGTKGLKRFSYERKSIGSVLDYKHNSSNRGSVVGLDPKSPNTSNRGSLIFLEPKSPASNRSSVTIRQVPISDENGKLADEEFENALQKFAFERDSFFEDIQFSAGQIAMPSKPRPKLKRIPTETKKDSSGAGSLRRRLSTMKPSLSRQNTTSKRSSVLTSKRLSGYNSVIPAPQRFQLQPNMHPLKRPYEPVLLDRYPPKSDTADNKRTPAFPDYVPMFVFPNDINVVSADERPRATWHGFTMTVGDNTRLYGMCLIYWIPLQHEAASELERQCERWRNLHMSPEEREMAADLGERLAQERAKLSRLLAELSSIPSDSAEREAHEEELVSVEERISLMSDALRPVRHGAASKIDGLTDGDTGFWTPRAYGILGRDGSMTGLWKEWLRAVVVPMTNGGILHVPPSSPRVGLWQPLERYIVNLCAEAPSPTTSITQVELAIRELRLYARKDAVNEISGSRNVDLYPLFRCLDVQTIIVLFEYVLSESRVILLSSHTAMLQLACSAIAHLLYPLKWANIFIPVLPARLIQALEAPCPYIVGIERRYENVELPEDDCVLVDLDNGIIEATAQPTQLPYQQRRKLTAILQLAAPHHYRYGVPLGPPKYVMEAFPHDTFPAENKSIFDSRAPVSQLGQLANLQSEGFGTCNPASKVPPMFNAFSSRRNEPTGSSHRPDTGSTLDNASPPSPDASPVSIDSAPVPLRMHRNDSGFSLQATLREKRAGILEGAMKRSSSFGLPRRPSLPFSGHQSTASVSTLASESWGGSSYAPSMYAPSTLAASTVLPHVGPAQPVKNTATTAWTEGHCLQWSGTDRKSICSLCDDKAEDGIYRCGSCGMIAHARCLGNVYLVCPVAFHPDQIMLAFTRCFASLFYRYRKHLTRANNEQKEAGLIHHFDMDDFVRKSPSETRDYLNMLKDTQSFNEFVHERETKPPSDPSIRLFDDVIMSKHNRGRGAIFSKGSKHQTDFLCDTRDHLWRTAVPPSPNTRVQEASQHVVGRTPAKLDSTLMREPRVMQGIPQLNKQKPRRKQVPSMLRPVPVAGGRDVRSSSEHGPSAGS